MLHVLMQVARNFALEKINQLNFGGQNYDKLHSFSIDSNHNGSIILTRRW